MRPFEFLSLDALISNCFLELFLNHFHLNGIASPFIICTPIRIFLIGIEAQDDLLDFGGILVRVLPPLAAAGAVPEALFGRGVDISNCCTVGGE